MVISDPTRVRNLSDLSDGFPDGFPDGFSDGFPDGFPDGFRMDL